jgi:hypothetical protein
MNTACASMRECPLSYVRVRTGGLAARPARLFHAKNGIARRKTKPQVSPSSGSAMPAIAIVAIPPAAIVGGRAQTSRFGSFRSAFTNSIVTSVGWASVRE